MADRPESRLSPGQRAYEERRARKAGMSLEKWLALKEKDRAAEEAKARKAAAPAKPAPAKKPGFFQRLLEKAERPLK
ncbi:MAG: hypothetical protein N2Z67_09280 [Acetobacteraceae bacterium]|nr:hypothetical protein [Acetobacteraceae bacterium]MDW8399858.1 hypothetical protein [Acetobacteraceae bacterium]